MRTPHAKHLVLAAAAASAGVLSAQTASASNPLEYPDNGAASFSRGGAWLATANEPIATHYNPAALATQGSGFSIEQQLNLNTVCYDRHGPNGAPENSGTTRFGAFEYMPVCNERESFPSTIPSISIAWRASQKLGFGIAVVPPAAYGTPDRAFPALAPGRNTGYQACVDNQNANGLDPSVCGTPVEGLPAPYRYMQLNQLTTILFPTIGVGYELFPNFRVGAAFISGIAVINTTVMGAINGSPGLQENAQNDSLSALRTKDLFVPGAILSVHWSATSQIDIAAWGRWIDDVHSTEGELEAVLKPYTTGYTGLKPVCQQPVAGNCNDAVYTNHANDAFRDFRFPLPPEARIGVRFHQPRTQANVIKGGDFGANGFKSRDPLHDDVFDVEVNGSYSLNESANTIEVRFAENPDGTGAKDLVPNGKLPPNADKWNGYKNSIGARLGTQINVIRDRFGVRAGTWIETQSQDPKWLSVAAVGALRGGVGGGIVFRQDFIDISIGYQYHWSAGLDNNGQGAMRGVVGTGQDADPKDPQFRTTKDAGKSAADRTQFRTNFTVNDGSITQHAHAFTLGGTVRF